MPSGYTSDIYDGKDQTFAEFAMQCARAFGALVLMRDEPADAPIPDEFAPSDYHVKALAKARGIYDRAITMSDDECAAEAARLADEWEAHRADEEITRAARQSRYESMLAEAMSWSPPTSEHRGLKKFMIEQLTESIKFDCSVYEYPSPTRDGETWRQETIAKAQRDIEYHSTENVKEIERAAGRSAWVQALRGSL